MFSHGSVLCGAEKAVRTHAARLDATGEFAHCDAGFLNYSEPRIEQVITGLAAEGLREVVVIPYFLVAGKFALGDLPLRIADIKHRLPHLKIILTQGLGGSKEITEALLQMSKPQGLHSALVPGMWPNFSDDCELRDKCPLRGSRYCREHTNPLSPLQDLSPKPVYPLPRDIEWRATGQQPERRILIAAHGSPDAKANDCLVKAADALRNHDEFTQVELAFLDCNEPAIPQALDQLAASHHGSLEIMIIPAFLHPGRHVIIDIPEHIEAARTRHLDVSFILMPYIGASPQITSLLLDKAHHAEEFFA